MTNREFNNLLSELLDTSDRDDEAKYNELKDTILDAMAMDHAHIRWEDMTW